MLKQRAVKRVCVCVVDVMTAQAADKVRRHPATAVAAVNGHHHPPVGGGRGADVAPSRPRTAAEYAGTVNGFVNLTNSFDSGIDVVGSVMGSTYF